jgi:hypothetical protein
MDIAERLRTVIANAAIMPAGTGGSVDVYASQNTQIIFDMNGYYAAQSGITLAQGSAAAPSLSFTGDPGTGLFSSGAGTLNLSTGGTSRLQISNGNTNVTGNLDVSGSGIVHGTFGVGPINTPQAERFTIIQPTPNTWSQYLATTGLGAGHSFGLVTAAGTNSQDVSLYARDQAGNPLLMVRGDGNVGIGTANPQGNVHVSSTNTGSTSLTLENLVGQTSRQVILSNYGSAGGGLYWPNQDSANTSSLLGPNLFVLRSTGGLSFSGSSTEEHMRISQDGHVRIGTNTPYEAKFAVNATGGSRAIQGTSFGTGFGVGVSASSDWIGLAAFGSHYAAELDGNVWVTGTITQSSDARLKREVSNLRYGLHEVMHLRPVTWTWKEKPEQGMQVGLIAQEVETVLPELVASEMDAERTKGLNYIGLVPVLIKGMQEQQLQIEAQQEQLTREREHNGKLEERLATLEALLGKISRVGVDQE